MNTRSETAQVYANKPFALNASSLVLVLLSLCSLAQPVSAAVNHVIHISVDGLRGDLLQQLVTNSPTDFPAFHRLQNEGVFTYNARCEVTHSTTIPNHSTMVTGRPVLRAEGQPDTVHHGYTSNFPGPSDTYHNSGNPNVSYKFSTFDVAHDHGLSTACYLGKTRLTIVQRSYNADNGGPDTIGEDNGRNKIDSFIVQDGFSDNLVEAITNSIYNAPVQYTFLHLVEPDIPGGHSFGWGSEDWNMWVQQTDTYVNRILAAIDANPALAGDIAIVLTADHGGGGGIFNNHTDASLFENYNIPFFVWGPGVPIPAGVNAHDWMLNRADQGMLQPAVTDDSQPVRNGDSPNLALALLGLPPVPGSFYHPELPPFEIALSITHQADAILLSWPAATPPLILESTGTLNPRQWSAVDFSGAIVEANTYTLTLAKATAPASQFFRLRQVAFRISNQPQSQTVQAGQDAVFSVGVSGQATVTYQWWFNGALLPEETGPTLVLESVSPNQSGTYQVQVSDGVDTLLSEPATLTVLLTPAFLAWPMDQTATVGDTVMEP